MSSIYQKMRLKSPSKILVLNMPDALKSALLDVPCSVDTQINGEYDVIILFAVDKQTAQDDIPLVLDVLNKNGDLWLAYPKGTSKKYNSDIKRDDTWQMFAPYHYRPVFQIAMDEDWSGIRVRHESLVNRN